MGEIMDVDSRQDLAAMAVLLLTHLSSSAR